MYLICEEGKGPLSEENLWYDGGTAKLYLQDQLLYKIYEKPEPHRRAVLDILIQNHTLRDVGVLPKKKIKTTSEKYGLVMNYIDGSVTFRQYLKNKRVPLERMISILIILSDNLKRINQEGIHFSDLHHNNILIKRMATHCLSILMMLSWNPTARIISAELPMNCMRLKKRASIMKEI